MAGALTGTTVLDLSRILAGPWATQILADYGAEVIKVEKPESGDDTRRWGPPFISQESGAEGDAAYFLSANRNKHSVTIDFTTEEGAELVRQLAAKADIVVENFKTGGLKKYGLDYESLRGVNPKLVYCSITGFGQSGPYAEKAGYDYLIQAMGGLMSITGQPDSAPGGEPLKVGVAVADLFTGLYATTAILAALHKAQASGEGQHLDVALFDCQVAMLANQASNYLVSGKAPERLGNAHPNIVPYQVFQTSDGHLVLAVGNDSQFTAFCEVAGCVGLAGDDAYKTNPDRVRNRDALIERLVPILKTRTTDDWISVFEEAGVPCGPIQDIEQVLESDLVSARQMLVRGPDDSDEEGQRYVNNPIKFSATPVENRNAPPQLGAQTRGLLAEKLALSEEELDRLQAQKVL